MKNHLKKIGLPLVLSLAMALPAQAGVIDLFSIDQAKLTDSTVGGGGVGSSVSDGGDGSILGGERDLFVELKSQTLVGNDARVQVAGGAVSFSVDSLSTATAVIQWDGADGSSAIDVDGLGSVDLTADSTGFLIDVLFADTGFTFLINTWWDAGTMSMSSSFTSLAVPPAGLLSFIPFNAPEFAGVDFTTISALEIIIDPLGTFISLDLTVSSLTTIPEPTGLALFALALFGLSTQRRRFLK